MTEPLTPADLERMRAEHVNDGYGCCAQCSIFSKAVLWKFPCDAARLLDELERVMLTHPSSFHIHSIDIGRALCGPSTSEELERRPPA